MKKTWSGFLLAAGMTVAVTAFGAAADHHVRVPFAPADSTSRVTGYANVVAQPQGGARIQVVLAGLEPNTTYTSFYYESADCTEPADKIVTFTSSDEGRAQFRGTSDDNLDKIGSISIRLGPDFGTLVACAALRPVK